MGSRHLIKYLSVPAAIVLALALAGQTLAATWTSPKTIASSEAVFLGGLVTLDNGTALVVYDDCGVPTECYSVKVRRSTNGGVTWQPPTVLSTNGYFASISGRGTNVDVTWAEERHLMYARSTDSGATFGDAKSLSFIRGGENSVARGPNGVVAVTWTNNYETGVIKARVSVDGGRSFRQRQVVVDGSEDAGNHVAVGEGVIYVSYMRGGALRVKRSLDSGTTWSSATLISNNVSGDFSITAAGDEAYVAYTSKNGSIRYRRTTNKGASWASEMLINGRDPWGSSPNISMQAGVVRTVYRASDGTYYRQSADGLNWSGAENVSEIAYAAEVGFMGSVVVAYMGLGEVRVRMREP